MSKRIIHTTPRLVVTTAAVLVSAAAFLAAQDNRPLSPSGTASTQVLGTYVKPSSGRGAPALGGETYQGGKWVEITYGRPLKRGRDLWGSGAAYGKDALVGAAIWRAGANVSTRLKTEVPLVIGGNTVAPGEYSVFIDLKENNWTLVVSSWAAQTRFDPNNKDALWGAYNYTPDKDVVHGRDAGAPSYDAWEGDGAGTRASSAQMAGADANRIGHTSPRMRFAVDAETLYRRPGLQRIRAFSFCVLLGAMLVSTTGVVAGQERTADVSFTDGSRITFQAYRDSTWQIWTVNADGKELKAERPLQQVRTEKYGIRPESSKV